MKAISFLFVMMIAGAGALFAQQQGSILVKVTPAGSANSSWIFATSENKNISDYHFENTLSGIIPNVNAVVFDWLQDEAQQKKMFEIMQFKGSRELKSVYKREDNIRYELMIMDKMQSDVQKYANTQPLYTMQLLRDKDHDGGTGYQNGVIFQLALNESKPVLSILNARLIEPIITAVSYEGQARILSNYVNRADAFIQADEDNLLQYLNGNADAIDKNNAGLQHPLYMDSIQPYIIAQLYEKITEYAAAQSALFVINADYLGGDAGIFKKLKDAGYTIEPQYFIMSKNDEATASTEESGDQMQADHFPDLQIQNTTAETRDVKITYGDPKLITNNIPKAYYDPFNDLFDIATADTAFIRTWSRIYGEDGNVYITTPVKAEWETSVTNTPNGDIKNYSYSVNHAKSDLFYSIGYTVYPPAFDPGNKADFFNDFIKRQIQKLKGELIAQRIISTPDFVGREFTVVVSDSFFVRSKIILRDNIVYQLLCGGPGDNAYGVYADMFFRSFKLDTKLANNWYLYENAMFTANLPTPPLISTQSVNTKYGPLTVQSYAAEDYKEGISYLVSVYLYPPAYDFGNQNNFFDQMVSGAEQQYVGKVIKTEKVKKKGLEGRYAELQLSNNKIYKIYFVMQGKTVYQYLAGGPALAMQSVNPDYFFSTFTFMGSDQ